jgi:hypothetical protein
MVVIMWYIIKLAVGWYPDVLFYEGVASLWAVHYNESGFLIVV